MGLTWKSHAYRSQQLLNNSTSTVSRVLARKMLVAMVFTVREVHTYGFRIRYS